MEVHGTLFDWTRHSPLRSEISEFTGSKQSVQLGEIVLMRCSLWRGEARGVVSG
jgi:hypothetical protein